MICPNCKKNTVEILLNKDGDYEYFNRYIMCIDCKWGETITSNSPVVRFFLFNYDLDRVFKEGRTAYLQGISITNNPWDLTNEEDKHTQWEEGWKFGSICVEKMGFISPLEKAKQMEKTIEQQQKVIEALMNGKTKVNNAIFEFTQNIENIVNT